MGLQNLKIPIQCPEIQKKFEKHTPEFSSPLSQIVYCSQIY